MQWSATAAPPDASAQLVRITSARTGAPSPRPFFRSRPGRALLISSTALAALTLALPYSGWLGHELGFTPLSAMLLLTLLAITAAYVVAAELVKRVFYRHRARASAGGQIPQPAPQSG